MEPSESTSTTPDSPGKTGGIAILASRLDPAGMNIAGFIRSAGTVEGSGGRARLVELESDLVTAELVPERLLPRPTTAVFISRHASESQTPCLTVHVPGNISEAQHGGRARTVSTAAPLMMKQALRQLWKLGSGTRYDVTVEATHHGPFTEVPCFFIEIGSGRREWLDPLAGEIVSKSVVAAIKDASNQARIAVGFGGPHYSQRFTKLLVETEYSLSHIVPKHQISCVDEEMVNQLFLRSVPQAGLAVLDWKGMRGSERRQLVELLDDAAVDYLRLRDCLGA